MESWVSVRSRGVPLHAATKRAKASGRLSAVGSGQSAVGGGTRSALTLGPASRTGRDGARADECGRGCTTGRWAHDAACQARAHPPPAQEPMRGMPGYNLTHSRATPAARRCPRQVLSSAHPGRARSRVHACRPSTRSDRIGQPGPAGGSALVAGARAAAVRTWVLSDDAAAAIASARCCRCAVGRDGRRGKDRCETNFKRLGPYTRFGSPTLGLSSQHYGRC